MKMTKRLLLALVLLVVCCTLAACQKASETTADPAPANTGAATTSNPADVMLTIGSETLTRAEYEDYLATLTNYYSNYGYDVADPAIAAMLKEFALQTGAEYAVMDQKVSELGLSLTADEKAAAISAAKEQWTATVEEGLAYYGVTAETSAEERAAVMVNVLAELETMGYNEDSYLADAQMYAAYDKLYDHVTKDAAVTDEQVVEYYNALVEVDKTTYENDAAAYEQAKYMNDMYIAYGMTDYVTEIYYKPAGYRLVTHILLEADEALLAAYTDLQAAYEEQQNTLEEGGEVTEALVTADEVENARLAILAFVQPTVDEINQKLANGASFADLIPEYTTDPGMSDAAAIAKGYEVHMDSVNWVIPFRDQAFTVNTIGAVTAPVVTDYGVHIIQYVADVPGGPVELTEEMKASFKTELLQSSQDEMYYDAISKWVDEANIVYSDEAKAILAASEAAQTTVTTEETPAE